MCLGVRPSAVVFMRQFLEFTSLLEDLLFRAGRDSEALKFCRAIVVSLC